MFPGQQGFGSGYGGDPNQMPGGGFNQPGYPGDVPQFPGSGGGGDQGGQFPPTDGDFGGFPGGGYSAGAMNEGHGDGTRAVGGPPPNQCQYMAGGQYGQQGAPPMGSGGYGGGGYGAPPPQMGGSGGYGAPPPQMGGSGGCGAPPPQMGGSGGYGAPPPQMGGNGGYGAPPPQMGPGGGGQGYGQPPSHLTPAQMQAASSVQLSNCSGRRRALLIGINYTGSKNALRGCINDVQTIRKFLMEHFRFTDKDMVILTDDQHDHSRQPTKDNILKGMRWLVHDPRPNDAFFLHYSGHGTSVSDKDGDEIDGKDEAICPVDFQKKGLIIDDEMNAIMVRTLPPGVRLTAIFDCCHSGSSLDLPFMYNSNGKLIKEDVRSIITSNAMSAAQAYLKGDTRSALSGLTSSLKTVMGGQKAVEKTKKTKSSLADVVMFSGCKDNQTSADAKEDTKFIGAMSSALTASLYEKPHQTYVQLLGDIRHRLQQKRHTQVPQLSTARLMDMNSTFIM